jgi:hypothetical protein
MEGKSSNAMKFEEIIKQMNKTLVFSYKNANFGSRDESRIGIFEYGTFNDYYTKFASVLLNLPKLEAEKRVKKSLGNMNILERLKKAKASGGLENQNGSISKGSVGGGMDLFNKNALKDINEA